MFTQFLDRLQKVNRKLFYGVTVGGGVLLFVVSGWFWWQKIYMDPERVFWAAIDNNLSTPGIIKHVEQSGEGASTVLDTQLSLGAVNASRTRVTATQEGPGGQSKVVTETIGTTTEDLVRYAELQVPADSEGKRPDLSKVKGVWGKTPVGEGKRAGRFLMEAVLNLSSNQPSVIFANLSHDKRAALMDLMRSKKVYDTDFQKAEKARDGGRDVLVYTVKVRPEAYVSMLQRYADYTGIGDVGLDPERYKEAQATNVEIHIDPLSRQVISVRYPDQDMREEYSGYGIQTAIAAPAGAIPLTELQQRIQGLQ